MAKKVVVMPEGDPAEVELYDEISEEDERQAEAGTLFSIQGERFANVQWSIHRYRTRREMMDDPSGEKTEWVSDLAGELRGEDLVERIGGGTFRFYGYVARPGYNGMKLAYNRLIRLAGPRRDFNTPATPPPAVASPPVATTTDSDRRLDRLERMIEALAMRPAPQTGLKEMAETMVMLQSLTPHTPNDRDVVKTMLEMVDKGIELGREREPAPAPEGEGAAQTMLKIAEIAGPIVGRMMDGLAARRGRRVPPAAPPEPPPTSAAPPASPSSATVVDEPEDPQAAVIRARMVVLVDELVIAVRDHADIEDVAETVERVVPVGDLEAILHLPDQVVIDDLVKQAPALDTPDARDYLVRLLAELRRDDDGEVGEVVVP